MAASEATQALAAGVMAGDRRALARAITLVESARADHRAEAIALVAACRASGREALRIGLSGTPGVGKSTFIESFGMMLTAQGLRVAVLAVDPSPLSAPRPVRRRWGAWRGARERRWPCARRRGLTWC